VPDPYPLIFEPILKEKVWGGRRLERYGKRLPPGARIGESWEIADLASTSPSGGGGGQARSVIARGPMAGRTLHEAMSLWGEDLLGAVRPTDDGGFPLLVKFLDAREHLSVQVHPSVAYASAHPGVHLKSECWFVLEAEAGSLIFKGVRAGVTHEDFERALRRSRGEGVVELLDTCAAEPGQCHSLPSGTVHALGAGVLVAEVQTPSDTTFRVYDWAAEYARGGRELHVEQALACIDFGPAPVATRAGAGTGVLAQTERFTIEHARLEADRGVPLGDDGFVIVMVVRGRACLETSGHGAGRQDLEMGRTVLVPAAGTPGAALACVGDEPASVLLVRCPVV